MSPILRTPLTPPKCSQIKQTLDNQQWYTSVGPWLKLPTYSNHPSHDTPENDAPQLKVMHPGHCTRKARIPNTSNLDARMLQRPPEHHWHWFQIYFSTSSPAAPHSLILIQVVSYVSLSCKFMAYSLLKHPSAVRTCHTEQDNLLPLWRYLVVAP